MQIPYVLPRVNGDPPYTVLYRLAMETLTACLFKGQKCFDKPEFIPLL
jgi:hypothetical protein